MAKSPVKTWSTPVAAEKKQLIPCSLCGGNLFKASYSCEGFSYVRCTACGLVQINPQPLEEEIKRRYGAILSAFPAEAAFNSRNISGECGFGEDYLAYELANESGYLNLQLLALRDADFDIHEKELFSKKNKPRVLDLGCAIGSLLVKLRDRGWETAGGEISLPQAEYGRSKHNLDIRNLPLEKNHFPAGYFDVVLASHLIEHLNDPAALAGEVNRILAAGGRFFVTTPNISGFQARLFGSRWRSAIFDHLYLFSVKTLKRLLEEKGFCIEKTSTWGGLAAGTAPLPVKRLFDRAARRFGFGDVMIMNARKL